MSLNKDVTTQTNFEDCSAQASDLSGDLAESRQTEPSLYLSNKIIPAVADCSPISRDCPPPPPPATNSLVKIACLQN